VLYDIIIIICGKCYSHSSGLSCHNKLQHGSTTAGNKSNIICNFGCKDRFTTYDDLIKHLQEVHNQSIESYKKEFNSMEEFTTWKEEFEKMTTTSSFVLHSAPKKRM
jgi:hypothetical protein